MDKDNDPVFISKLLRSEVDKLRDKFGQPFVDLLISLEGALKAGNAQESRFFSRKLYDLIMDSGDSRLRGWLSDRLEANQHHATTLPAELGDTKFPLSHADTGFEFEGVLSDKDFDFEMPKAKMKDDVKASHSASVPAKGVDSDTQFFFELRQNGAPTKFAKTSSTLDLVFKLAAPTDDALAALSGEEVKRLKREGTIIGLKVVPVWYQLNDEEPYKTGCIQSGALVPEITFQLHAWSSKQLNAGVHVNLYKEESKRPILLYSFFLEIPIVDDAEEVILPSPGFPIEINLDTSGKPVAVELDLQTTNNQIVVTYTYHDSSERKIKGKKATLKELTLEKINKHLPILETLAKEANEIKSWKKSTDFFQLSDESDRATAVNLLAEAGYSLWEVLTTDPDLEAILVRIKDLPEGSRIRIRTNGVYIPWEILYPEKFDGEDVNPKDGTSLWPVKNQLFWGARFIIESTEFLKTNDNQARQSEMTMHQSIASDSKAYFCINMTGDGLQQPAQAHCGWIMKWRDDRKKSAKEVPTIEILDNGETVRKVFVGKEKLTAKWIYLYSHGRGGGGSPAAELEVGGEAGYIQPWDISDTTPYKGRPIVFLNTCSSADFGLFSALNFYSVMRKKGALGVLGTSFSVPTLVAAAIGQRISQDYIEGKDDIGCLLLKMRRDLLRNLVPIGLFYTLHCPGDITAFGTKKRSECDLYDKEPGL